ncbi:hypothetical protein Pve01_82680 [Planomonospora venezuelensis]|nr:hypothetical protein Pve01_82680 [Planomonospora venezuelensis]
MQNRIRKGLVSMVRATLSRWRASTTRLRIVWALDATVGHVASRTVRSSSNGGVIVLATAGMGNIGDEAMLESCLANAPGPVTIVIQRPESFSPSLNASRMVLPNLVDGPMLKRLPDVVRLVRRLKKASEFWVIGADVMDGVYYPPSAVSRFSLVATASRLGVRSRVLGFSWSEDAGPAAVEAIRRVAGSTRLYVRDPISHRRLIELGVGQAIAAADIVFALPNPPSAPSQGVPTSDGKLALINVSGLIQGRMDQVPEFVDIVRHLNSNGWVIGVVPHVVRDGDDDLAAQAVLRSVIGSTQGIWFLDEKPSVAEVQALVSQADLVITGRMHLAVLGIAAGVPAIILGTQGKVAGLCELVGRGATEVEPRPGFGREVIVESCNMESLGLDQVRSEVTSVRPKLEEMARRNFGGAAA